MTSVSDRQTFVHFDHHAYPLVLDCETRRLNSKETTAASAASNI